MKFRLRTFVSNTLSTYPKLWFVLRKLVNIAEEKEREELLVPFLVNPSSVAIDVGANRGDYTAAILRCTPNVVSIEPNPENARVLKQVFGKRIRLIVGAASNKDEDVVLRIPEYGSGYATIEDSNQFACNGIKSVHVRSYRIDDLSLETVSFIKVDVEGHELSVLEGALNLLKRDRPSILVEAEERYRKGSVSSLRSLLEPLGYEGFMLLNGQMVSIRRFDPAIHQNREVARARSLTQKHLDTYVKNFVFLAATNDFQAARERFEYWESQAVS
jgi:FkbM family methyltransferase